MNKRLILTREEKEKFFGVGEWLDEPDHSEFEHEGINCKILRIIQGNLDGNHLLGGHLCGYVQIPEDHKLYSLDDDGIYVLDDLLDVDIHGGITFFQDHWIGFDCAHSGDIVPSLEYLRRGYPEIAPFERTYKNWAFVLEETKRLAESLRKMDKNNK